MGGGGAFDDRGLGELGAKIAVRTELAEKGFAQGLGVLLGLGVGLLDLGAAAWRWRTGDRHRALFGEAEGDKEGGVVHSDTDLLARRVERLGERQREMQGEQALVVVEPIV